MALLKQTERENLDVGRVRGDGGQWRDGDWQRQNSGLFL